MLFRSNISMSMDSPPSPLSPLAFTLTRVHRPLLQPIRHMPVEALPAHSRPYAALSARILSTVLALVLVDIDGYMDGELGPRLRGATPPAPPILFVSLHILSYSVSHLTRLHSCRECTPFANDHITNYSSQYPRLLHRPAVQWNRSPEMDMEAKTDTDTS